MNLRLRSTTIHNLLLAMLVTLFAGCATMPFGKPPGNNIGSCEGRIQFESGRRTSFRIDLFTSNNDGQFYLTIPGMYRYSPIEDFDFSGDSIEIDLASPKRTIECMLIGDSLTFNGNFEGISGSFTFDLDN